MNTNRSDWIQIDPNEYKSIRMNTNRSEWLQIDPNEYKSIWMNTNRSDWIQIDLNEYKWTNKSNRMNTNRSRMNTNRILPTKIADIEAFDIRSNEWPERGPQWSMINDFRPSHIHIYHRFSRPSDHREPRIALFSSKVPPTFLQLQSQSSQWLCPVPPPVQLISIGNR